MYYKCFLRSINVVSPFLLLKHNTTIFHFFDFGFKYFFIYKQNSKQMYLILFWFTVLSIFFIYNKSTNKLKFWILALLTPSMKFTRELLQSSSLKDKFHFKMFTVIIKIMEYILVFFIVIWFIFYWKILAYKNYAN